MLFKQDGAHSPRSNCCCYSFLNVTGVPCVGFYLALLSSLGLHHESTSVSQPHRSVPGYGPVALQLGLKRGWRSLEAGCAGWAGARGNSYSNSVSDAHTAWLLTRQILLYAWTSASCGWVVWGTGGSSPMWRNFQALVGS